MIFKTKILRPRFDKVYYEEMKQKQLDLYEPDFSQPTSDETETKFNPNGGVTKLFDFDPQTFDDKISTTRDEEFILQQAMDKN